MRSVSWPRSRASHPGMGRLGKVDLRPPIPNPHVVALEIPVHQAIVVQNAVLQQQLRRRVAELPPGRDVAARFSPPKFFHELDAANEHRFFLLPGQGDGVLVGIAVDANFVTRLRDHARFLGKDSMECPGINQEVLIPSRSKSFQETRCAHLAGKDASGDVARRVLAPVGTQPPRHRVHVHPVGAQNPLFSHFSFPFGRTLPSVCAASIALAPIR